MTTYVAACLPAADVPVIAATDYMRAYAEPIRSLLPAPYTVLGTDGFGRSDNVANMRDFFEVDAKMIAYSACVAKYQLQQMTLDALQAARLRYDIDVDHVDPMTH